MTKAEARIWNRALEAVARNLRKDWDDNGPWTNWLSKSIAARVRRMKVKHGK